MSTPYPTLKEDGFFYTNGKSEWLKYSTEKDILYFSGIIYNWKELSGNEGDFSLEKLYALYKTMGDELFLKLNGKASILIQTGTDVLVYRDQWGEGAQIFYKNGQYADSMELALEHFADAKSMNKIALNSFLMYGFIPGPLTLVEGLSLVPAGHLLRYTNGNEELRHLFDYKEFKSNTISIGMEEAKEEYGRLLRASIKRRIGNSSTVGALLSGGYDSGGNIAVLREVFEGQIKSYSIGFKDNPFSELPYAKLMAEQFGAEHHEYLMDQPDVEHLPDAIRGFGQPFAESGFMLNNVAMRMVKDENLPVIIGGDGNDQLFGTTGKELALQHLLKSYGLSVFQRMFSGLSANNFFEKDNIWFKLRFHNHKILNAMLPDNFGFNAHSMKDLFKLGKVDIHPVFAETPKKYKDFTELHDLHNLYLDIRHSINEVILNKASRLSSYYGNNLAFTYLDKDIYEFVKQLPLNIRLKGEVKDLAKGRGVTKYLHKAFTKPKLPEDVTSRKKQGGFSPLAIFFKDKEYRQRIYAYILNSEFTQLYSKPDKIQSFMNAFEKSMQGEAYWFWYKQLKSNQMISLLIMALWWDMYVNKKELATLSDYMG
jgi:asparagine synthase (glutamine-hydrolysing)